MKVRANYLLVKCMFFATSVHARKTRITWVNGIGYEREDHMKETKEISKLFGGKRVYGLYNPTYKSHGDDMVGYIGDLTQAGTQKLGRTTNEVNSLVKHLKEAVQSVGTNGRVVHIAHSQGALITQLASKQLSAEEMNKIEVLAFGGAAVLRKTAEFPFHRCINYYSVNDPLLWVVPSAEKALRSGFVVDQAFCFLSPRVGDPIEDHALLAPTYCQALQWEGVRFQKQYQSFLYRNTRPLLLFLMVCFQALSERLAAILKTIVRHIVEPYANFWRLFCFLVIRVWNFLCTRLVEPSRLVLVVVIERARQGLLRSARTKEEEKRNAVEPPSTSTTALARLIAKATARQRSASQTQSVPTPT